MTMGKADATDVLLARHQARRCQGVPTLTVLRGPVSLCIQVWRTWNRQRPIPVVAVGIDPLEAVTTWAESATTQPLLEQAVFQWLAIRVGENAESVRARLGAMTPHDLERFWTANALDADQDHVAAVCRWIVHADVTGLPSFPARTVAERLLSEVFSGYAHGLKLMNALAALMPEDRLPSVLFAPQSGDDPLPWLARAVSLASSWVVSLPSLPVAIAVPGAWIDIYCGHGAQSRDLAMVREGEIAIHGLNESMLADRLRASGLDPLKWEAGAQTLASLGTDEGLASLFVEAASHLERQTSCEEEDRARSAAERFLFEQLNSLPQTLNLFALNQRLDFRHGAAHMEVDLVASDLMLVIEIDGSYYHLKDQQSYRRDRRKDWQLQRHGYLVLRFLADDIVQRLEEILETILAAVAWRRSATYERPGQE